MRFLLIAAATMAAAAASPSIAQERSEIGNGRLFTNDFFGDGQDRWRTGSYVYSHLRGRSAYDGSQQGFGDILEYRLRGEIIAPRAGIGESGDRPYVGALSFGLHTHYEVGEVNASLGADVTFTGPQTGLDEFQNRFHDAFDLPIPTQTNQIDDDTYLSATAAVSQTIFLNEGVSVRPFAEAQVGVEDVIRVGGDVVVGAVGQSDLMLRDVVTGQLYRSTQSEDKGFSYVFGADFAAVGGSVFLPEDQGYIASDTRTRARAGVNFQGSDSFNMFYGLTYLSEEYEGQPEGQVVGSLNLNFNF